MSKSISFTAEGASYDLALHSKDGTLCLTGLGNGEKIDVEISNIVNDPPWIHVHINGRIESCAVAYDSEGVWLSLKGRTFLLERSRPSNETKSATSGTPEVRAPMTGTVLAVHVAQGDKVSRGTLLAVIEAMKMEYRIESELDGSVDQINCAAGDLIEVGTVMIRLTPDAES